jgi:hypothetical protein
MRTVRNGCATGLLRGLCNGVARSNAIACGFGAGGVSSKPRPLGEGGYRLPLFAGMIGQYFGVAYIAAATAGTAERVAPGLPPIW